MSSFWLHMGHFISPFSLGWFFFSSYICSLIFIMSFTRSLSHLTMYSFLYHLSSFTVLSLVLFSISFSSPFCEFYSELYLLVFFSTLTSSLLLSLPISYLILLLLSTLSRRRCFSGFALFVLVFVWQIYPCCYLWYCGIASMSYNLFFALLASKRCCSW